MTKRLWRGPLWYRLSLGWIVVPIAWVGIAAWYMVLFTVGWIFVLPYRMIRRGQRREKIEARRHAELVQEMRGQ